MLASGVENMQNALVGIKPGTGDRCREFTDADDMRATFEQLDGFVHRGCARFATHLVQSEIVLKEELMPGLSQMQAFLSQRGSEHNLQLMKELGLPNWSEYLKGICRELKINIRAVQRAIKSFREPTGHPPRKEEKVVHLTTAQQRRLLEASVVTNEMVSALETGGDYETPLAEYKKVALDSGEISQMLDAPGPPDRVTSLGVKLAGEVLKEPVSPPVKRHANKLVEMAKTIWQKPDEEQQEELNLPAVAKELDQKQNFTEFEDPQDRKALFDIWVAVKRLMKCSVCHKRNADCTYSRDYLPVCARCQKNPAKLFSLT
jgi:hypothetical protein